MKSLVIFLSIFSLLQANEASFLKNITQLTSSSMGFEKAGEAYFSPDEKTIIFQAVPNGKEHYQIYTMDLEEKVPRMVSTGLGACTCGFFHPNGKKIIFASSHADISCSCPEVPGYQRKSGSYMWAFTPYMNIYEANLDGSELKALTSGPSYHAEGAYSHDGKKIVFASNSSGTMNIYTMDADGQNVFAVTNTDYSYNGGPFFSPDDSQIVFRSDRDEEHMLQIFTINADGTNEQQLTDNDAVNWAPYWHPSGRYIAFTTSLHGHHQYEIYVVDVETKALTRITENPSFDGLPVFSNSGRKLMWTSKRDGIASHIFIADFEFTDRSFANVGHFAE